jgi:DNA-3-methyladenine glycosylase
VNVVCGPAGVAVAVLLRAGRVVAGEDLARSRRTARPGLPAWPVRPLAARDLARGPARLCQALAIDRRQDGADLCVPGSALRLRAAAALARPLPAPAITPPLPAISAGPRVGVRMGAETPWRFWTPGDPTVSVYRPHARVRRGDQ